MKRKLLYAEDEVFLGKIVKDSLEARGFEVHMVTDGQQALRLMESVRPDLCVLDIMMPVMDGYTLAGEIRRQHPRLPILFLTAKAQTEDVLKGFQAGGNDYLRKPFSLEELIVRIENLLNLTNGQADAPSQTATGQFLTIGRYRFWPNRYELHIDEQVRKLSHREAEIIHLLCTHQNQIIQRKDILMQIWHDDSFFNSRNLDVYITKIRSYLKDDPQIQLISIKGVGYHVLVG